MKDTKKRALIITLFILVLVLSAIAAMLGFRILNLKKYDDQMTLGAKYLKELDYENAEICYKKAIEIDEKKAAAYLQLSVVYIKQERYEDAKDILDQASDKATHMTEKEKEQLQANLEEVKKQENSTNTSGKPAESIGEEVAQQEKEMYYTRLKQDLKEVQHFNLAKIDSVEGYMLDQRSNWYDPNGILSACFDDFDGDGHLEMIVVQIVDEDCEQGLYSKGVQMHLYDIADGKVVLGNGAMIQRTRDDGYRPPMFLMPQQSRLDFFVSVVTVNGKKQLLIERYEGSTVFSDGYSQDYWVFGMEGDDLELQSCLTQNGYGSYGVSYTGMWEDKDGITWEEIMYDEEQDTGIFRTFEAAVAGFFEKVGIHAQYIDHRTSILTDQNESYPVLAYHTDMTGKVGEGNSVHMVLKVTDHTRLREILGIDVQQQDTEEWKNEYWHYLSNKLDEPNAVCRFLYMNDDDIPELLIDYGTTAGGGEICTYDGSQVVSQWIWSYGLTCVERSNYCCDNAGHMDSYYDMIYRIEEGKFVLVAEGAVEGVINNGSITYTYIWDGTEVTEEEYKQHENEYVDSNLAGNLYDNMIPVSEFMDQLNRG